MLKNRFKTIKYVEKPLKKLQKMCKNSKKNTKTIEKPLKWQKAVKMSRKRQQC